MVDKLVNWEKEKINVGCIIVIRMWDCMLNASWKYIKKKCTNIFEIQTSNIKKNNDMFK